MEKAKKKGETEIEAKGSDDRSLCLFQQKHSHPIPNILTIQSLTNSKTHQNPQIIFNSFTPSTLFNSIFIHTHTHTKREKENSEELKESQIKTTFTPPPLSLSHTHKLRLVFPGEKLLGKKFSNLCF